MKQMIKTAIFLNYNYMASFSLVSVLLQKLDAFSGEPFATFHSQTTALFSVTERETVI